MLDVLKAMVITVVFLTFGAAVLIAIPVLTALTVPAIVFGIVWFLIKVIKEDEQDSDPKE